MAMKNLVLGVVIENALDQSDCLIFKILISQKLFEVESSLFACNKIYPWKLQFDQEVFLGCGQAFLACPWCSNIINHQYLWKGF